MFEWFTATQELKVLVDLALISAGENPMETDRISSLHTSCLGFAPLIFDLRESEEHKVNFDHLVKACDPVWKAVKTDHKLPQKLVRLETYLCNFMLLLLFVTLFELAFYRTLVRRYRTWLQSICEGILKLKMGCYFPIPFHCC